jgi:hypothetical protein
MFAARPDAKTMLSGLYFANPYDARRMGFTVRLEDGLRVTYYCEGFNDQTRFDRVRAVGERDRPDVVVAGGASCSSIPTRTTSTSSGSARGPPQSSWRPCGTSRRRSRSTPSSRVAVWLSESTARARSPPQ